MSSHNTVDFPAPEGPTKAIVSPGAGVVADRRRVLGPHHPDTLTSRHQHATYLGHSGAYQQAADLFAELATDQRLAMGPHHIETLIARYQHGVYLMAAQDFPRAYRALSAVLPDCEREIGAEHQISSLVRDDLDRCRQYVAEGAGRVG